MSMALNCHKTMAEEYDEKLLIHLAEMMDNELRAYQWMYTQVKDQQIEEKKRAEAAQKEVDRAAHYMAVGILLLLCSIVGAIFWWRV